jgi:putative endonuclease
MFTTYVLFNPQYRTYTGQTEDLNDRLLMHNDISLEKARFHKTTYKKGPWKILFKKDFATRKEARDYEKYLKSGKGREEIKIISERARQGG